MASLPRRGAVAAPLELPATAAASAFNARFDNDLLTSLPYADAALPDGWRERAEAVVREEVRCPELHRPHCLTRLQLRRSNVTEEDYLSKIPPAVLALKARARASA